MTQPHAQHPRPDMQRERWLNLNGQWRFAFDPTMIGEQEGWHQPGTYAKNMQITVPYPWESPLSGVENPAYRGAAWYEREITIPAEWQGYHAYLNFGAIDWSARVWLNGRLIAEHENGYLPFGCDLSPYLQPGQSGTVIVRAYDIAEAVTLVGKQVPRWYTYSSGIWQTVWLEARPASHITTIRTAPNVPQAHAEMSLKLNIAQAGSFTLRLSSPDDQLTAAEQIYHLEAGEQSVALTLPVPNPQLWSPETPHLYNLQVDLTAAGPEPADRVTTYFGMRSVGRACWAGKPYEYILLNDEPVYLRGALDQAFHPDGLHAYPSDEAIRADIQLAKDLGLNMLRCHIKINDPRYYTWADKLGLLIMYDWPSPDLDSPQMRRIWETSLHGAIERDFNHPSIFAWVLFNETWGLTNHDTTEGHAWLAEMYRLAKRIDPSRLIEDNSPNKYDHVATDINSWHFYLNSYEQVRQHIQRVVNETYPGSGFNYVEGGEYVQGIEPLMNSEYAGISARMGDRDIAWSFKYQTNEMRRHDKICGYVYTELSDIEWEHNGFVNYDRSPKFFGYEAFVPDMTVADLNQPDFVGLDAPPCQTLSPEAEFSAPIFVSHFGPAMDTAQVAWQLDFTDRFGQKQTIQAAEIPVAPTRFGVVVLADPLQISLPAENGLATIALWLKDETGHIRCRNYVNIELREQSNALIEEQRNRWVFRLRPGSFSQCSWPYPSVEPSGAKFAASGSGWVEYELAQISPQPVTRLTGIRLIFEAAARAGRAKIDWPQVIQGLNYPQTEEQQFPTDLAVSLNGIKIGSVRLADDPADARGVLSHHHNYDPGSYGYLVKLTADAAALQAIRETLSGSSPLTLRFTVPAEAEHNGGLSLYGETLGGFPLDPTIILETED